MWWLWLIGLIGLYVLIFFVLAPLTIPFMLRQPLPSRIPKVVEEAIKQLEQESGTPYEYIKNAAEFILSTAHCGRFATIRHVRLAFETDLKRLFTRQGFMHCTHLNHLMRVLLAKSKYFSDEQIRLRSTMVNFNIHQYLQVHVAGQWYDVDLGGDWMGVPLGKHVWGFR